MGTMEKIVLFQTLENFRDGLSQQPASSFLFLMKPLLRMSLSASMKETDVQAKKRQSLLSKMNLHLTLMTNSCPPSTTVLEILSNNLDLDISSYTRIVIRDCPCENIYCYCTRSCFQIMSGKES